MKNVCALLITLLCLVGTAAYGAVSEDNNVYVRKDVFEVYMQNINANMERIFQKLDNMESKINNISDRLSGLSSRIDGLEAKLSERIDGLDARLSARIDGLDARIGDLRNDIYLGLVILGIIIALPMVQKMLQAHIDRKATKPSVTLEDVMRLIEENNALLEKKFHV